MIRNATIDDAEHLLEIYAYYVNNTAITFEYDVPSLEEFRNRISLERPAKTGASFNLPVTDSVGTGTIHDTRNRRNG